MYNTYLRPYAYAPHCIHACLRPFVYAPLPSLCTHLSSTLCSTPAPPSLHLCLRQCVSAPPSLYTLLSTPLLPPLWVLSHKELFRSKQVYESVRVQGVQEKLWVFFTIHCNPSLTYIVVRDLQSSQHNASVQSLLLAGNFFLQPIAAECW